MVTVRSLEFMRDSPNGHLHHPQVITIEKWVGFFHNPEMVRLVCCPHELAITG